MAFTAVPFRDTDTARMNAARQIREAVFCIEQGISAEDEWDGEDPACEHFLVMKGDAPIATGRVRPYGEGVFKIERIAVLKPHRGSGAGAFVMQAILMHMEKQAQTLVLNAQAGVENFYLKLGFVPEGAPFDEAGIRHMRMVKRR